MTRTPSDASQSPSPRRYSAINPSARFVPGDREGNGTVLQNLFSVRVAKVAAHIAPPDLAVGATLQPYHRHCQSQPEDHTPSGASGLSEPFCPCGWVAMTTLPIRANKSRGDRHLSALPSLSPADTARGPFGACLAANNTEHRSARNMQCIAPQSQKPRGAG